MTTDDTDSLTARRAETRVGTVLREKYRLDRVIGIGGMAVVYKATHRNQAEFAVKMLHPELSMNEDVRTRFLREGYAANSVKHPGAVLVVDDDVAEDGTAFLVMELLAGAPVESLWERSDQRLPVRAVLTVADQLLDVLAAAHAKGIVHRDIKPENLFVTRDGTLKVLDFGIARVRDATVMPGSGKGTGTGVLLGTPAFMAPEQAYAKPSEIDGQSDIWAVGATLFTLLTGQLVHEGDNAAQLMIHAATTRARSVTSLVSNVPPSVAQIIDRALAFEKASRWPTAAAMREAIVQASVDTFGQAPAKAALAAILAADEFGNAATSEGVAVVQDTRPGAVTGAVVSRMAHAATESAPGWAPIRTTGQPVSSPAQVVSSPGHPLSSTSQPTVTMRRGGGRVAIAAAGVVVLAIAGAAVVQELRMHGTVASNGDAEVVAPRTDAALHACKPDDVGDCATLCSKQDAPSCAVLAHAYRVGRGVSKDEARALTLFKQACDGGSASGCSGLGYMYENALGGTRDEARAAALYKQACDGGDAAGCSELGHMYLKGRGVPKDLAQAAALYKQACDGANANGCANLGHLLARGAGVPRDPVQALALYKQSCDAGSAVGCSFLGQAYAKGTGVTKDEAHAATLLKQGCDGGSAHGCFGLGELYADGRGVAKDVVHAVALFKQSCDGGGAAGCAGLGEMYADGRGVTKDEVRAVALFKQGCANDAEPGCFDLGLMYEKGVGAPVDRTKAVELYRKSCKAEDPWGCAQLRRLGVR